VSDCPYERLPTGYWECPTCGHVTLKPYATPPRRNCKFPQPHSGTNHTHTPLPPPPTNGPGTAIKSILSELGIQPTASCGCDAMVAKMNVWGPDCNDHREEIEAHLRTAYDSADLATKLRAGANAIAQGKPLTISGLLDLAIERSNLDPTPGSR